jgi:hypothetical protein
VEIVPEIRSATCRSGIIQTLTGTVKSDSMMAEPVLSSTALPAPLELR